MRLTWIPCAKRRATLDMHFQILISDKFFLNQDTAHLFAFFAACLIVSSLLLSARSARNYTEAKSGFNEVPADGSRRALLHSVDK